MTTTPKQGTGSALQTLRIRAGARLADVAEKAGTTAAYLSRVESGKARPSPQYVARITGAIAVLMQSRAEQDQDIAV